MKSDDPDGRTRRCARASPPSRSAMRSHLGARASARPFVADVRPAPGRYLPAPRTLEEDAALGVVPVRGLAQARLQFDVEGGAELPARPRAQVSAFAESETPV